MTAPRVLFTVASENKKTGPIVASYIEATTCPDVCPLKKAGCYASSGPVNLQWRKTKDPAKSISWDEYLGRLRKVEPGRLFRHGVAGDLPGIGDRLDAGLLGELVEASTRLMGFAYTHKPLDGPGEAVAVNLANAKGFVVNLSAENLAGADRKAALGVGPVVTLLPSDPASVPSYTPEGRRVVVCPAQTRDDVTCLSCKLCARANRASIVGFLAHGSQRKKADQVYLGG